MTTGRLANRRTALPRPMNGWRLEWLRLRRSPRGIALLGVFSGYGLLGPVLARYMADLVKRMGSDSAISITVRPPVPKDGIITYVNQVSQIGLVVAVVVAAGALAVDSRRGMSTFFRTRANTMWQLMLPRYVLPALAAVVAYTLGTVLAWYETALLIGAVPTAPLLAGVLCQAVFLVFSIAVVAAAASLVRGTLGAISISLAVLLFLPILGFIGPVHHWLPTALTNAPVNLLNEASLSDYVPAIAVATALTPALLTLAVLRLRHRDA
jgi:ABC-2 type transport system permease protein